MAAVDGDPGARRAVLAESRKERLLLPRPSCEEYERVADAGDDDVAVMLELVARVTAKDALRFAARAADAGTRRRVVAYGGAMHNDRAPRPELALEARAPRGGQLGQTGADSRNFGGVDGEREAAGDGDRRHGPTLRQHAEMAQHFAVTRRRCRALPVLMEGRWS